MLQPSPKNTVAMADGAADPWKVSLVDTGAETMTGIDGHKVFALPHDRLRETLKKYNRLQ